MQVLVRDNDALKKKMQREGIFREITPIMNKLIVLGHRYVIKILPSIHQHLLLTKLTAR